MIVIMTIFAMILPSLKAQNADKDAAGKVVLDGSVAGAFRGPGLSLLNGVWTFPLNGPARRPSKKFMVDTAKTYRLSGEFRVVGVESPVGEFTLGFDPYDEQVRKINIINILMVKNASLAELAAPVMDGDSTLILRGGTEWKLYPHFSLAFNAQEDNSDIPNFDISPRIKLDSIKHRDDGDIELTLIAPIKASYPAGIKVRLHSDGPLNIYACGFGKLTGQWQTLSGTISGSEGQIKWYKSTASAEVVLVLLAPKQEGGKLELRNVKVEEIEK